MNQASITITAGNFTHCGPAWNATHPTGEPVYKLYSIVAGQATVILADKPYPLRAGQIVLFSGYCLQENRCETFMDVYWLHFLPESPRLANRLAHSPPFRQWSIDSLRHWEPIWRRLKRLNQLSDPDHWQLQAMVVYLLGEHLRRQADPTSTARNESDPLQPALDYMDTHWRQAPSLETVARQVHLAPNYFHRKFRKRFGMTPYHYMLTRRMNHAVALIGRSDLPIQAIASQCGYDNPFYFSRTFRRFFGQSPTRMRKPPSP